MTHIGEINRAKTHCPKGHEYSAENTMTHHGARVCLKCKAARERVRRERIKEAVDIKFS
jgi:hypothetical protein